jgi:hypothetical protein
MMTLNKLCGMNQYIGTKLQKFIAGWGGVPTNASPAQKPVPEPGDTHRNRSAAAATAGFAEIPHITQGDHRSKKIFFL